MSASKTAVSGALKAVSTVGTAPTAAAAIAGAITNQSHQDLIQVASPKSGAIVYRLDYQGNVFTSPSIGVATPTAALARRSGTSFAAAYPQLNGNASDVLQIANGSVVFRIDSTGAAHTNS